MPRVSLISNARKMKGSLILCFAFVVGLEAGTVHLAGSQKERASQIALECIKESGVKPEVIAEAKKGHISNDEGFKKFTFCFFKKSGIVNSDGKLNVEAALAKLPPGVDKADFTKVLEECKNKKGKDPVDNAFEIFKCYSAGTKTHILL